MAPVKVKLLVKATKVKKQDQAQAFARVLNAGLVNKCCDGIKILGNGKLTKSLTVKVGAYSEGAKQKIESAGGKAEVI